jgi:hypothetical protein
LVLKGQRILGGRELNAMSFVSSAFVNYFLHELFLFQPRQPQEAI